jgi:hypothetical protein
MGPDREMLSDRAVRREIDCRATGSTCEVVLRRTQCGERAPDTLRSARLSRRGGGMPRARPCRRGRRRRVPSRRTSSRGRRGPARRPAPRACGRWRAPRACARRVRRSCARRSRSGSAHRRG